MPTRNTVAARNTRLHADRRGAAAVEFALLLPLLTLMLTGVWQYGALFFSYNAMTTAARDGARALATGSATEAEVRANVVASMPGWMPAADVTVVARNEASTGTAFVDTRITVPAAKATVFSIGPMPESIEAFSTMEREI
jgi:Flp pilus assembly protein TadG